MQIIIQSINFSWIEIKPKIYVLQQKYSRYILV